MGSPGKGSDGLGSLLDLIGNVGSGFGDRPDGGRLVRVSEPDIDMFVKVLRAQDRNAFVPLEGIEVNQGFRQALRAILQRGSMPGRHGDSPLEGESGFPEVLAQGRSFVRALVHWRERVERAQLAQELDYLADSGVFDPDEADRLRELKRQNPTLVGPEWDQHWLRVSKEWEAKREKLSALLREAARLYESGQAGGDVFPYPTLENAKRRARFEGLALRYRGWGGADALQRIANIVDETPLEVLFPVARPRPLGLTPGQVGRRGGASDPEGALKGMVIREIAARLPSDWSDWRGFSAIARLVRAVGLANCSPQYVRSVLLRGRT